MGLIGGFFWSRSHVIYCLLRRRKKASRVAFQTYLDKVHGGFANETCDLLYSSKKPIKLLRESEIPRQPARNFHILPINFKDFNNKSAFTVFCVPHVHPQVENRLLSRRFVNYIHSASGHAPAPEPPMQLAPDISPRAGQIEFVCSPFLLSQHGRLFVR